MSSDMKKHRARRSRRERALQARLLSGFWLIPDVWEGGCLEEQPHPPRLLGCLLVPPYLGTFPQLSKAPGPSSCALRAISSLVGKGDSAGGIGYPGNSLGWVWEPCLHMMAGLARAIPKLGAPPVYGLCKAQVTANLLRGVPDLASACLLWASASSTHTG